jgi:hypothetical protein
MARTPEQILRDVIGGQTIQIAGLLAEVEKLREQIAALTPTPDPPKG